MFNTMPLQITPKTIGMASEQEQLEEMVQHISEAEKSSTLLFPEYGAYTVMGSVKAFGVLRYQAVKNDVSVITSLNLGHKDLPYSNPQDNYNLNFIFSRKGKVYAPQGKITPQSFEMEHLDKNSPKMNVEAYDYLNKITLMQDGVEYTAFIFNCSDRYIMAAFTFHELKADAAICPSNFGYGAQDNATKVMDYAVRAALFKQAFLSNIEQRLSNEDREKGKKPLAKGIEKVIDYDGIKLINYSRREMQKLIKENCAIYPDEEIKSFYEMREKLTVNGTFTVPLSRSLENILDLQLKRDRKVIEI